MCRSLNKAEAGKTPERSRKVAGDGMWRILSCDITAEENPSRLKTWNEAHERLGEGVSQVVRSVGRAKLGRRLDNRSNTIFMLLVRGQGSDRGMTTTEARIYGVSAMNQLKSSSTVKKNDKFDDNTRQENTSKADW